MVSSGLYFALRIGFNSFSFLYNSTFHHFEASGAQSEGFDIETSSRYWTCLTCVDSHRIWRWNTTLALRDASVSNVGSTPRHCTDSEMPSIQIVPSKDWKPDCWSTTARTIAIRKYPVQSTLVEQTNRWGVTLKCFTLATALWCCRMFILEPLCGCHSLL